MTRVIEKYSKLHCSIREEVYRDYKCGEIERNTFPYKGSIVDGVEDSSLEMDSNL